MHAKSLRISEKNSIKRKTRFLSGGGEGWLQLRSEDATGGGSYARNEKEKKIITRGITRNNFQKSVKVRKSIFISLLCVTKKARVIISRDSRTCMAANSSPDWSASSQLSITFIEIVTESLTDRVCQFPCRLLCVQRVRTTDSCCRFCVCRHTCYTRTVGTTNCLTNGISVYFSNLTLWHIHY